MVKHRARQPSGFDLRDTSRYFARDVIVREASVTLAVTLEAQAAQESDFVWTRIMARVEPRRLS